jgi:hypothetical protein
MTYQPKLARFTSRDPLPDDGNMLLDPMPDQWNRDYRYTDNNPVTMVDPSGLVGAASYGGINAWDPYDRINGGKAPGDWTCDRAKTQLGKQIKEWRTQGYNYAADLLQHFLSNSGKEYSATAANIKETATHAKDKVCGLIGDDACEHRKGDSALAGC